MGMLSNCNSAAVVRMDKEENKQYAGRAAVLCRRVAAPAAAALSHGVFHFFCTCQIGKTINPIPEALPCHCFRRNNFGTSIILLFCAEVSAAVFENERLFSHFPVFLFFFLCFPVRRCLPPSREEPQGAALERSSHRSHRAQRALPGLPHPLLRPPLRAGRKGRAELPFLLLLRRGGEVSGTFWRCRRKRPGGAGGAEGPGQRHGQVGPGGPALDRGGAGGRHQREQLALVSSGSGMGMRGRAAGGMGGRR